MQRYKTKNSLIKRLFFISLPFTLLASIFYAGLIIYIESQSFKTQKTNLIKTQIQQFAKVVAIPAYKLDKPFINRYLNQYAQDFQILCIELLTDQGFQARAPNDCTHPDSHDVAFFSEPIQHESEYIGVVVASFPMILDNERLNFILLSRIPTAIIALLSLFLVVFFVFKRWVVRPIKAIMKSIEASDNDGKHHPVNWKSNDEIGTLVNIFNHAQQKKVEHGAMLICAKEKAEYALEKLQLAQSQLVESEKMASLGSLVAGISHEINTPLGVARTSASYLDDSVKALETAFYEGTLTKNELKEFIDTFNDGMHLMTANLVRASELMTSFKQVSADQSYDEIRDFNLHDYLQETVYTLKPNLKRYQVAIILDCEDSIIMHSLPGAFSQIFTNLIMNSLIHAYEPSDHGSIHINANVIDDNIELTYADDGSGMTEDVKKKIFDPFFTTKRGNGGTGLGMHIIYNIVTHKLQGSIDVNSTLGQGSQFIMTLPRVIHKKNNNEEDD